MHCLHRTKVCQLCRPRSEAVACTLLCVGIVDALVLSALAARFVLQMAMIYLHVLLRPSEMREVVITMVISRFHFTRDVPAHLARREDAAVPLLALKLTIKAGAEVAIVRAVARTVPATQNSIVAILTRHFKLVRMRLCVDSSTVCRGPRLGRIASQNFCLGVVLVALVHSVVVGVSDVERRGRRRSAGLRPKVVQLACMGAAVSRLAGRIAHHAAELGCLQNWAHA